jgi:AraC family transcriptional regulator
LHPDAAPQHPFHVKKILLSTPALAVAVCRYAPGERHGRHTDRHSRISLLLRGGYREDGAAGAVRMAPGDVLLKSARAYHEDAFGDDGAELLALEFLTDDPFDQQADPALWRRRADAFALRHATSVLEAALAGDYKAVATAGDDLLAASDDDERAGASAPRWLEHLKRTLQEQTLATVCVATEARSAGAHPAHASRLFRRCYGASITEFAQTQSVRRAMRALAGGGASLSDIALDAGFYDQSHMTRIFRRVTGRTPGAHRAMFAAALG